MSIKFVFTFLTDFLHYLHCSCLLITANFKCHILTTISIQNQLTSSVDKHNIILDM